MRARAVAMAAVSIAALGSVSAAQVADSAHPAPGRLIGVFDSESGRPVEEVQVRDVFSGVYVLTTATGTARMAFLTFRGAAAIVQLRKIGYEPKQLVLSRGDTTPITETMERVTTLPTVVTTAKYRIDRDEGRWGGFAQRCRSGSATCIGEEEMAKRPSANLADLLVNAPGITIGACSKGTGRDGQCGRIAMRSTTIPPSYCKPTMFVDGFEWHIDSPIDMVPGRPAEAPFTPTNVKAVEVYASERVRPLRFTGDPTCGAIVIWTK
jgi:TonB-dependent Receptor Plug Domain